MVSYYYPTDLLPALANNIREELRAEAASGDLDEHDLESVRDRDGNDNSLVGNTDVSAGDEPVIDDHVGHGVENEPPRGASDSCEGRDHGQVDHHDERGPESTTTSVNREASCTDDDEMVQTLVGDEEVIYSLVAKGRRNRVQRQPPANVVKLWRGPVIELRRRRRRNRAGRYTLELEIEPWAPETRHDRQWFDARRQWVSVNAFEQLWRRGRVVEDSQDGEGV